MNTPVVNVNVQDFTQQASVPATGIVCVSGVTRRGPINDPSILISTMNQFEALYGGAAPKSMFGSDAKGLDKFHIYVQRMLAYGARLRINRVTHRAGQSETASEVEPKKATAISVKANITIDSDPTASEIFVVEPKYPGADYNGIKVEVKAATNGNPNAFDIKLTWPSNPDGSESYSAVPMPDPNLEWEKQTFLNNLNKLSSTFNFRKAATAPTLTGATKVEIVPATTVFAGGTDGAPVTDSDFIGDGTDNGFHAFDTVSDSMIVAVPGARIDAIHTAGVAYATLRQDMVYYGSVLAVPGKAEEAATAKDEAIGDSEFAQISTGGIRHYDTASDMEIELDEIADTIGLTVWTHNNRGAWFDPASKQSATVLNALGVVQNFGTPARLSELNILANHGINAMVYRDGSIEWTSSYTSQKTNSALSFVSSMFLVFYIKNTMIPVYRSYLKEPCDTGTFKAMWNQIRPFLDNLARTSTRALWKYEYMGDQDASSLDTLTVNQKNDVQMGKYKAYLKLWLIVPMIEVTLNIMLVQGDGEVGIEIA